MITRCFGDGEHAFAFTLPLLKDLENKTGRPLGEHFARMASGLFFINDLAEIIRLGLFGGGMAPERAAQLIAAYGPPTVPIERWQILAATLLTYLHGGEKAVSDKPIDASQISVSSITAEAAPGTNGESAHG
jgi:hypothetical protein